MRTLIRPDRLAPAIAILVVGALALVSPPTGATAAERVFQLAPAARADAVTTGPDGDLWFAGYRGEPAPPLDPNAVGGIVGKVSSTGEVTEYASGRRMRLHAIAAGVDGALWAVEPQGRAIVRISSAGEFTTFPLASGAEPSSISAGADGALWFTERGRDQLGRITVKGAISEYPIPAGSDAASIVAGTGGDLWFAAPGTGSIDRIDPVGTVASFPVGEGSRPRRLALGPDGNVYFTQSAPRIGRVTPEGEVTNFALAAPAVQIAAGPDEDLWFSTKLSFPTSGSTDRYLAGGAAIASIATDGHPSYAYCATEECLRPSALGLGPGGEVWFGTRTAVVEGGGSSGIFASEASGYVGRFRPPPLRPTVLSSLIERGGHARLRIDCRGGSAGERCHGRVVLCGGATDGRFLALRSSRFNLYSVESGRVGWQATRGVSHLVSGRRVAVVNALGGCRGNPDGLKRVAISH